MLITEKNDAVEPDAKQPYFILSWVDRPSAFSIGYTIFSTVRKAAKLAVYDAIMINVKKYQIPAIVRVDIALELIRKKKF